ncbi:outer membrane protein [Bauldia sp.]|uniref:outer membrane protein n=1 Tax=Bauldia sp. TaxID=2575872 RepID=UPI003BAA2B07
MSRMRILGAAAVALAIGMGGAQAADIYNPPPANIVYNPTPAYSWTGGYAGALIGYGWGTPKVGSREWDADGLVGGVFGGYNFQTNPNMVFGFETDITATGMSGKRNGIRVENPWNGTLRARAGIAFDRAMIYATGGVAAASLDVKRGGKSDQALRAGYTVGAGIEAALTDTVVGRVEYRYTHIGKHSYDTKPKTKAEFSSNQVLVGLGVKF